MIKQIIGTLDKKIAIKYGIPEYANKKIVLYPNDRRHCEKRHLQDFPDSKNFYYVLSRLDLIIDSPDIVFYNKKNSSLEYYKNIGNNISVRVRVEPGNELRVKTFFPVNETKVKEKEAKVKFLESYDQYVVGEE